MISEVPDFKLCPQCGKTKPAGDFTRDNSRRDGLKFCCNPCLKTYKPTSVRRDLSNYYKECESCRRTLHSKRFLYIQSTPDHLEDKCRTCRSWRKKRTPPPLQVVERFEEQLNQIIATCLAGLCEKYELPVNDALAAHRSEFEQMIEVAFNKHFDDKLWKMPVWIHSSSSPNFAV